jgi:hypothetical protein
MRQWNNAAALSAVTKSARNILGINQAEHRTNAIVSGQTRWLAGVTGCVSVVTFAMVQGLGLVSGFLIVGALVAGRFSRIGRDLIWFGAGVVTLSELPIGIGILRLSLRGGTDPRVIASMAASVLLIVWCDVALVRDAIKARRASRAREID